MRCAVVSVVLFFVAAPSWGQSPAARLVLNTNAPASTETGASSPGDSEAASTPHVPPAIVIGFLGGFIHPDNSVHGGVQLAKHLRQQYPSGVYVNVFENHHSERALEQIRRLLDMDRDGALSTGEKQQARVILYGHSWGASEVVYLARQLQREQIPIMLTIQIDSVQKGGQDDSTIPTNVAHAINFYQVDGLVHGRKRIRAADPSRTEILGSFRYDYAVHPISCTGYPWFARLLEKTHIEIECDPSLISRVESLIRSELLTASPEQATEQAKEAPPAK